MAFDAADAPVNGAEELIACVALDQDLLPRLQRGNGAASPFALGFWDPRGVGFNVGLEDGLICVTDNAVSGGTRPVSCERIRQLGASRHDHHEQRQGADGY
jgi:hypothetical protein